MYTHVDLPCAHTLLYHVHTRRPTMYTHVTIPCTHTSTHHVHTRSYTMYTRVHPPCAHTSTHHVHTRQPAMYTHANPPCTHTPTHHAPYNTCCSIRVLLCSTTHSSFKPCVYDACKFMKIISDMDSVHLHNSIQRRDSLAALTGCTPPERAAPFPPFTFAARRTIEHPEVRLSLRLV